MKKILLAIVLLGSIQAYSQQLYIGYSMEPLYSIIGRIPYPVSNNLFLHYTPQNSYFSMQFGVNYYIGAPQLIVPLIFSPEFSSVRKITFTPEIGLCPILYFNKSTYDKIMDLIIQGSLRIDFRTNSRLVPTAALGIQLFPSYYEIENKWGDESIYIGEQIILPYFSLGLKYRLNKE